MAPPSGTNPPPSPSTPGHEPPVAPRRPTELKAHGDARVDDWYWLNERDNTEVRSLLEAENAYVDASTARLGELKDRLFGEIRARIAETDLSVPVRKGPWWYYLRTEEGLDYAIWCRLPVEGEGRDPSVPPGSEVGDAARATGDSGDVPPRWDDEQIMLDENVLAEGHGFLSVANISVSPGHNRLAYAVDTAGDERFTLKVRDLDTGADLDEAIENTSYGVAWANDDATVFYVRPDDSNRPFQLWRHRLGEGPDLDALIYEEPDEHFHLGVGRTKDGVFVVAELHSQVTSEVHLIPADHPGEPLVVVDGRRHGVEYTVEHHSGKLLILTNDEAENFRLMTTADDDLDRTQWRELIAHRSDARLIGIDPFARHLVSYERLGGEPRRPRRSLT